MQASRVTLRHLRAFVAVAHIGSFTGASAHLSLSQPALTAVIKQLEELLGLSLFDRTTRHVALSITGRGFLPIAERLLTDFDAAITDIHAVANLRSGIVRIAALYSVATMIIPSAVHEFARLHPGVRMHLRDDNSAAVRQRVQMNEVDFGFAGQESEDSELDFIPVYRDRLVLVASANHPLITRQKSVSWDDLADYDFVGLGRDTSIRRAVEGISGIADTVASPRYETSNTPTLQALIEAGLGVSTISSLAALRMDSARLKWRLIRGSPVMTEVFLLQRKGRSLSPAAERMKTLLLNHIRQLASRNELIESRLP